MCCTKWWMNIRGNWLVPTVAVSLVACSGGNDSAKAAPDPARAATAARSAASAVTYSTNFNLTENPIGESGRWINGKTIGLDWNNVQSASGKAYAADYATGYNDPIAVLNTAFAPDQYAQGTVHRASGYSPSVSHEIELLLRFRINANQAYGYEVLWGHGGSAAIVRWNGPMGNYRPLVDGLHIGKAADGDVLRAEIVGGLIRVYKNGALVITSPADATWSSGQPGIGFWPKVGATLKSYGWKSFQAGNL